MTLTERFKADAQRDSEAAKYRQLADAAAKKDMAQQAAVFGHQKGIQDGGLAAMQTLASQFDIRPKMNPNINYGVEQGLGFQAASIPQTDAGYDAYMAEQQYNMSKGIN